MASSTSTSSSLLTSTSQSVSTSISSATILTSQTYSQTLANSLSPTSSTLPQTLSTTSISLSPTAVISASATAAPSTSPNTLPTKGAWIGIVVGAFIAGLFVGFFSALLILWKRSKPASEPELIPVRPDKKSFDSRGFTASPVQHASEPAISDLALDQYFALPTPDKSLASELKSLGHLIEQHVEDYYHLSPVSQSVTSLNEVLEGLELSSTSGTGALDPIQLASMAVNPEERHVALRHIITGVVFGSMSVDFMRNSPDKLSLIPSPLTSVINHAALCEEDLGSQKIVSIALTRWRQLSVFLLNPKRSERGCMVLDESSVRPQARELVLALNNVLGAFVDQGTRSSQEEHLQEVVLECAKFGLVILSQPAEYKYQFGSEDGKEVIVCPGLERVTNTAGIRCDPETVAAPERHKINPKT